jgi:hypothetical protein
MSNPVELKPCEEQETCPWYLDLNTGCDCLHIPVCKHLKETP